MNKFLKDIEIKNFKSIKELKLEAKKVNIFIGKPNVGKSNILEALSIPNLSYTHSYEKPLNELARFELFQDLFFDQNTYLDIEIKFDSNLSIIGFNKVMNLYLVYFGSQYDGVKKYIEESHAPGEIMNHIVHERNNESFYLGLFSENGKKNTFRFGKTIANVKKFQFKLFERYDSAYSSFLLPPHGINLFSVIKENKELKKEISRLFESYNLEFVLRMADRKFETQKKVDGLAYSYPYLNTADTLQRYIFYLAVLYSNKDSVLLLEEPEVHSFPPYTKMLADRITKDETNQYFISTHSPYLLQTIIENTSLSDLNIYITYYENFETKVKALDEEEIRQILDDSIDIFFNLDRFLEK